jgi:recombination DNA repair RAD52 pathway protein
MLLDAAERGIKQGEAIVETENVFRDRTIQNGQARTYNEKNKELSEDKNKAGKLRGLFSNLLQEETDYIEVDVVEIEPLMQNPLYRLMSKND